MQGVRPIVRFAGMPRRCAAGWGAGHRWALAPIAGAARRVSGLPRWSSARSTIGYRLHHRGRQAPTKAVCASTPDNSPDRPQFRRKPPRRVPGAARGDCAAAAVTAVAVTSRMASGARPAASVWTNDIRDLRALGPALRGPTRCSVGRPNEADANGACDDREETVKRRRPRQRADGAARGRISVASAPPSPWFTNLTAPPCSCATSLTKASPRPVPLRPVSGRGSEKNFSKTRSRA